MGDFFKAQDDRTKPPTRSINTVHEHMRRHNPIRWQRMRSDARWMRRMLKKLDLNPEDWRWYL